MTERSAGRVKADSRNFENAAPKIAFLTDDPIEILEYAYAAARDGMPVALVTLVEITGGSARPLGAQMAVRADGLYCGFVSGGCTEPAVAAEAVETLRAGHDRVLRLGQGSPFFDIVLPCGGGISLSIHILRSTDAVGRILTELAARRPAGLEYDPKLEAVVHQVVGDSRSGWRGGAFVTGYRPRARLLVCGSAIEMTMTVRVAQAAGFEVHAADPQKDPGPFLSMIDENSAVALLLHDLDRELPILGAALISRPFYIGALGSQRTHEKRVAALRKSGVAEADIARIKAPIGIFGKARDASAIALSVVADIAAARTHHLLARG
ncbi:hypothetical protein ASE71_09005 [Ensifer sp. Root954]|nr:MULTISPECIES: XdhC family protein [Ensifer]KQX43163.1 hypothetical protein ASD49_10875 [Ensifer sp. Root1298]KQX72712.1 hypothetical protein ASD41_11375 [Ensifer sp. Root1312]KRC15678.1 hypothetical protein ASE29_10930 [Ensifer sp. Root74]KRD58951.1 hypothetical protein ASE71_09005 [Ensifer sp. Root954]